MFLSAKKKIILIMKVKKVLKQDGRKINKCYYETIFLNAPV
jgi:hypothetical protein